jgi:putative phosphoesterase
MKIAVLADIHGNSVALHAALEDLARQGNVDHIVVAGDFFAPGSDTTAILGALRQLPHARFLRGNADRYLLDKSYTTVYGAEGWQGLLRQAFHWTAERLSQAEWDFLASLPFSQVIGAEGRQLLFVHGSPRSDEEGLTFETTAAELEWMGLDPQVDLLCCGHTHLPMDRIIGGVRVVNVGSVGLPFDGDSRASYAIISNLEAATVANIRVELRRVAYDTEQAAQRLFVTKHPAAELGAYNVQNGRPRGNIDIYQYQRTG